MKLSEFIEMVRFQVPDAVSGGVTETQIITLINQAPDEINLLSGIYKGYTDFNVVAEQQTYPLSTNVPNYLGTSKGGALWKNADDRWTPLYAKTEKWFDLYDQDWRAQDSADPTNYYIEGDTFFVDPKPSTSKTNGFRLYHLKKATPMSNGDRYPWTNTTSEVTAFKAMDNAIIAYVRFQLSPSLGKDSTGAALTEKQFKEIVLAGKRKILRRRDVMSDYSYGMMVN